MEFATRSTRTYASARESLNVFTQKPMCIKFNARASEAAYTVVKIMFESNELCALFDSIAVCWNQIR